MACLEPEDYRDQIKLLTKDLPYLNIMAEENARHTWNSHIIYYDYEDDVEHEKSVSREPWKHKGNEPTFFGFEEVLKGVPKTCHQRLTLIEDLSPQLIGYLGVAFEIPPQAFTDHLESSGYSAIPEEDTFGNWHVQLSAFGHRVVSWSRPVLPLIGLTDELRAKLIMGLAPAIKRTFTTRFDIPWSIVRHRTKTNIRRSCVQLCPRPSFHQARRLPDYPIGWEEKATIWTHEGSNCRLGTF